MSEVMLQQTTVRTVAGRFERFLERFPDVRSLARAREEAVLAAWSGLGYYARARNLHRAAKILLSEHAGRIPRDPVVLQTLPGFGPYMANAVPALAYGRYALPIDANIRRVVARLFASNEPAVRLAEVVSRRRTSDSIAALFDLGQLVCRPKAPACGVCPLRSACAARRLGTIEKFPQARPRRRRRVVHLAAAVFTRNDRLFLERRPAGWLEGLWQFPCEEAASAALARRKLGRRFGRLPIKPLATARHAVVHLDLRIRAYAVPAGRAPARGRWTRPSEMSRSAVPSLTRKIAEQVRDRVSV